MRKSEYHLLSILLLFLPSFLIGQNINTLSPCPKSPNCVSTEEGRRWKSMDPIPFDMPADTALRKLETQMKTYPNATLIERQDQYLHYQFKTKIGSFIDDVEFLVDATKRQIEFRSASRKGYGDMGKNKRRMKMIRNDWQQMLPSRK